MSATPRPDAEGGEARVELREGAAGGGVLALSGRLDVSTAADARRAMLDRLGGWRGTALEVDASGIEKGDVSGMSLIYELSEGLLVPGVRARVLGLRPELAGLLAVFPTGEALGVLTETPPRRSTLAEVGAATQSMLADARAQAIFIGAVVFGFAAALRRPRLMRWHEVAVVFE